MNYSLRDSATKKNKKSKCCALIIAVSEYEASGYSPLPGAASDAAELDEYFKAQDVETRVTTNPTRAEILAALVHTTSTLDPNTYDQLIIYFAGHGHWAEPYFGKRQSFLVPIDTLPRDTNRRPHEFLLPTNLLLAYADATPIRQVLVLFDACFAEDLGSRLFRPNTTLGAVDGPCRLILTSGSPGEEVPDKSIFCRNLLQGLKGQVSTGQDYVVSASRLAEHLYRTVSSMSKGAQHPQFASFSAHGTDTGDFIFRFLERYRTTPPTQEPTIRDEILRAIEHQLPKEVGSLLSHRLEELVHHALDEYLSKKGKPNR